jgi:hypothetical protein
VATFYWEPYDETVNQLALLLGWPFGTFIALMVFQVSMRRANVKTAHVARCVVYSCDVFIWPAIATLLFYAGCSIDKLWHGQSTYVGGFIRLRARDDSIVNLAWAASTLIFGYRLCVAYRRYLQFRRAAAMVIASQLIVFLAACIWLLRNHIL